MPPTPRLCDCAVSAARWVSGLAGGSVATGLIEALETPCRPQLVRLVAAWPASWLSKVPLRGGGGGGGGGGVVL